MATKKTNETKVAQAKKTTAKKPVKASPKITVVKKKKVLFVCSEGAPFIATGGLADVMGSLPKALAKNDNYDISVIMPLYSKIGWDLR